MPSDWPRNILPYTEEKLRALSTVESVALYSDAIDRPLVEADLTAAQRVIAGTLMDAGLLVRRGDALLPMNLHQRDPETDVSGVVEHKLAVLGFMELILEETRRALDAKGHLALAALGAVKLPAHPKIVARAVAIIAEAEDQLRALAEEEGVDGADEMRVVVYIGSRG